MNPFLPISKLFTLLILPRRHLLSLLISFLFPMYSPSQYLPLITAHYIHNFRRSRIPLRCEPTCNWTGVTFLLLGVDLWVLASPWPWLLFLLAPLLSHLFPLQPRVLCNWSCGLSQTLLRTETKQWESRESDLHSHYLKSSVSPHGQRSTKWVIKMILWDKNKKLLEYLFLTYHFIFIRCICYSSSYII